MGPRAASEISECPQASHKGSITYPSHPVATSSKSIMQLVQPGLQPEDDKTSPDCISPQIQPVSASRRPSAVPEQLPAPTLRKLLDEVSQSVGAAPSATAGARLHCKVEDALEQSPGASTSLEVLKPSMVSSLVSSPPASPKGSFLPLSAAPIGLQTPPLPPLTTVTTSAAAASAGSWRHFQNSPVSCSTGAVTTPALAAARAWPSSHACAAAAAAAAGAKGSPWGGVFDSDNQAIGSRLVHATMCTLKSPSRPPCFHGQGAWDLPRSSPRHKGKQLMFEPGGPEPHNADEAAAMQAFEEVLQRVCDPKAWQMMGIATDDDPVSSPDHNQLSTTHECCPSNVAAAGAAESRVSGWQRVAEVCSASHNHMPSLLQQALAESEPSAEAAAAAVQLGCGAEAGAASKHHHMSSSSHSARVNSGGCSGLGGFDFNRSSPGSQGCTALVSAANGIWRQRHCISSRGPGSQQLAEGLGAQGAHSSVDEGNNRSHGDGSTCDDDDDDDDDEGCDISEDTSPEEGGEDLASGDSDSGEEDDQLERDSDLPPVPEGQQGGGEWGEPLAGVDGVHGRPNWSYERRKWFIK